MIATQNSKLLDRAWRYIEKRPPSIQGRGGSKALFNVACDLIKGFLLKYEDAWSLLVRWNAIYSQPLWCEPDLHDKLNGAAKSNRPDGYLLNKQEMLRPQVVPDFENERESKARLRQKWRQFQPLSHAEVQIIASLRCLPVSAVIAAARNGFLKRAKVDQHECFIISEEIFAQAMRFDDGLLPTKQGPKRKKNLPGSQGAFIGKRWLGDSSVKVLLLEGAVGLLEALAALEIVAPANGWTIVAATSAGSRFNRDPELLKLLAGRFVRIIPDNDPNPEAAHDGAASWLTYLRAVGAQVEVRTLPPGIKDLGPLVADPSRHAETLNAVFL
jgi:hypothetical protein